MNTGYESCEPYWSYDYEFDRDEFYIRGTNEKVSYIQDGFTLRRATHDWHTNWYVNSIICSGGRLVGEVRFIPG